MKKWKHELRITHLFTENEDKESILKSMNSIANVIELKSYLDDFDNQFSFRDVDNLEEANDLINELYDYCDTNGIWVAPKGWIK